MDFKLKTVCRIFLILVLMFIWGNSLLDAGKSAEVSGSVTEIVIETAEKITGADLEGRITDHIVRKIAHLSQFAALGFFAFPSFDFRKLYIAFGGFLAAAIDESIQFFVPGRGPQFSDVLIDTLGFITGLFISCLLCCIFAKYIKIKDHRKAV